MSRRIAKKVLLIGWDAADWKFIRPLMDAGWMPTLKKFMGEGVWGNLATLEPMLSPMLWTSIATGKRAEKHGICGFVEPEPSGNGYRIVTSTSRRCKAIWNILTQCGLSSNVVSWYASHPAEPIRGAVVTNQFSKVNVGLGQPWPLTAGTVHPARLEAALTEMRLHPGELGKPDLQPFVPNFSAVDQEKDKSLATIARLLAECVSVHAAGTWLMEHEPADFTAIYYDAIDHFGHGFMEFHPPRRPHVNEREFELYKDVVSGCYKYHDMLLARLLELAGEETTVIIASDHGFHSDEGRPRVASNDPTGPTLWHRPYGIVCMRGPGIKRGEEIYGASLLDLTPTILTLLGLPVGGDMDGRVLWQALTEPVAVERIMSWDAVPGEPAESGMHPPGYVQDAEASDAAVKQLIDLGYIDPPNAKQQELAGWAEREGRFNLAWALLHSGQLEKAAEMFAALRVERPQEKRHLTMLIRCRYLLGDYEACRELAGPYMKDFGETPTGRLLAGAVALGEGRYDDAVAHLQAGEKVQGRLPDVHYLLGRSYLKMERWADAERAFGRAIELDGDHARAYDGLALTLLHLERNQEAAEAALTAVGLQHDLAGGHFHLGAALARLGRGAEAITAFEQVVALRPESALAHQWLARLHEQVRGDAERAKEHARLAQQLSNEAALKQRTTRAVERGRLDVNLLPPG